jgi:anti-sigma regulatory factor (Ser/Thr protein kinase)/anti-anti-sigma regulatory factor
VLRIPADVSRLAEVRQFIRQQATHMGADADATHDVVLAVDELATNSIVHGYKGAPGVVEVEVGSQGGSMVVWLRDHAPPFDPNDAPEPNPSLPLELRPKGGMGIFLSRAVSEQLTYRRTTDGNELTIVMAIAQGQRRWHVLNIDVTQESDKAPVAVVSLAGELDAATYLDVIAAARDLVAQGTTNILLDLSGLEYMGSSGLFAIHSVAMLLRGEEPPDPESGWGAIHQASHEESSEHLKLLSPPPQVDRVLERSGMKRFFETFTDRSAALASF